MSADHSEREALRAEVVRMSTRVPISRFQSWDANRCREFIAASKAGQRIAGRSNASELQLREAAGLLRPFWG